MFPFGGVPLPFLDPFLLRQQQMLALQREAFFQRQHMNMLQQQRQAHFQQRNWDEYHSHGHYGWEKRSERCWQQGWGQRRGWGRPRSWKRRPPGHQTSTNPGGRWVTEVPTPAGDTEGASHVEQGPPGTSDAISVSSGDYSGLTSSTQARAGKGRGIKPVGRSTGSAWKHPNDDKEPLRRKRRRLEPAAGMPTSSGHEESARVSNGRPIGVSFGLLPVQLPPCHRSEDVQEGPHQNPPPEVTQRRSWTLGEVPPCVETVGGKQPPHGKGKFLPSDGKSSRD